MSDGALALNSISTSGSRFRRIQKALERQPTRGVRVALLCKSPASRLAEWEAKDVGPETALAIEQNIIDHAEELGFLVVDFSIVWESEDGRAILSPGISWRRPADEHSPLDNAQLDGGERTSKLQDQRHQEANMRMWSQNHQLQVRTYAEQNQQMHERVMQAHEIIDELRGELAAANEAIAKMQHRIAPAEEEDHKPTPLQEKALEMLGQYLPVFLAAQMAKPQDDKK